MNEMELLRELRVGLPPARAEARALARARLVAHTELGARPRSARRFAWPSRPLRLAGAVALAAALAVVVVALGVFSGSGRVESAAAEALRQTASVAAADGSPGLAPPAPGQFLYTRTKVVQLEGWMPHGYSGSKAEPRVFTPHVGDPYPQALVPAVVEKWTAPDGTIRQRETLGRVHFFKAADQRRWEAAGSPPPWSFDPRWQDATRNGSGHLVKEFTTRKWAPDIHFPDPAEIPTDPKALRHAVADGQIRKPWLFFPAPKGGTLEVGETIEGLFEIIGKPTATAAIRAAAFDALAEMSGIELERNVTDIAGRHGAAVALADGAGGVQAEYIFDPDTAELLAASETVVRPKEIDRSVPRGTVFRQTAYLEAGVVDSTHETAAEAR
jgi:hypothetical protein